MKRRSQVVRRLMQRRETLENRKRSTRTVPSQLGIDARAAVSRGRRERATGMDVVIGAMADAIGVAGRTVRLGGRA